MNKLTPNTYVILDECVENGITEGWNKAHKYIEDEETINLLQKSEDLLKKYLSDYIMLNISEKIYISKLGRLK